MIQHCIVCRQRFVGAPSLRTCSARCERTAPQPTSSEPAIAAAECDESIRWKQERAARALVPKPPPPPAPTSQAKAIAAGLAETRRNIRLMLTDARWRS